MTGITVAELFRQDRRLVILRFLADDEGYSLNTSLLQSALESVGHRVSRDMVEGDAAWLEAQGLLRLERVGPVTVVHLTQAGADVAAGRAKHPGVRKPGPRM